MSKHCNQLFFKNSLILQQQQQSLHQKDLKEYSPTFRNIMSEVCSKISKEKGRNKMINQYEGQLPPLINIKRYNTLDQGKTSQDRCYSLRISSLVNKSKEANLSLQPLSVKNQKPFKKKVNLLELFRSKKQKFDESLVNSSTNDSHVQQFLQKAIKLTHQNNGNSQNSPNSMKNVKKFKFSFKQKLNFQAKSPLQLKSKGNTIVKWQPWSTSQQPFYQI